MSKRFGRNQKRELKRTIAYLENKREHDANLLQLQSVVLSEQRHTIENVEEVLGKYFIGLPPDKIDVNFIPPKWQIYLDGHHNVVSYDARHNYDLKRTITYLTTIQAKSYRDELQQMVHLTLKSEDGKVNYAVSSTEFNRYPERQLIEILAKMFASHMMEK